MNEREKLRRQKALQLIAERRIEPRGAGRFAVQGDGGEYETVYVGRPRSCTCPAGAVWAREKLHRYGRKACYHLEAASMLAREAKREAQSLS